MKELQLFIESPLANSFGQTMLHSLWQGVILVSVYLIGVRFLKSTTQKACLGLSTFGLQFIASIATFLYLKQAVGPASGLASGTLEASHSFGLTLTNSVNAAPWTELIQNQAHWLALGWIIGFSFLLIRQLGGMAYVQFLKNSATLSLSHSSQRALDTVLANVEGRLPSFQVFESSNVNTAMVLGFLKPIILIPAAFAVSLTCEQLELIIAHEIAHIKRNDFVINLAQTILENLFFYHPVYWLVSHQIRENREHACDDWAANLTGNRVLLAQTLAQIQLGSVAPQLAMAFGKKHTPVLNRIQRLLGINPEGHKVKLTAILLMLAALTTVSLVKANQTQELPRTDQTQLDNELKNLEAPVDAIELIKKDLKSPIEIIEPIIIEDKVALPDSNIQSSSNREQKITYHIGDKDIRIRNKTYDIEIDEESIIVNGKAQTLNASQKKELKEHWASMRAASKDITETSAEINVEVQKMEKIQEHIMGEINMNPAKDPDFQKASSKMQKEAEKIGLLAQKFQEEMTKLDPRAENYTKELEKLQEKLEIAIKPHQDNITLFEVGMEDFELRMKGLKAKYKNIEAPMKELDVVLKEKEVIIEKSASKMEYHHDQIIRMLPKEVQKSLGEISEGHRLPPPPPTSRPLPPPPPRKKAKLVSPMQPVQPIKPVTD
ncbi:MAG: bla regulator protein BlaR1 [Arcticibacterium sp.]|jgi:bla regulator protein BlaR1